MATEAEAARPADPDKINLASFGNMVPHLHWHRDPALPRRPPLPRVGVGRSAARGRDPPCRRCGRPRARAIDGALHPADRTENERSHGLQPARAVCPRPAAEAAPDRFRATHASLAHRQRPCSRPCWRPTSTSRSWRRRARRSPSCRAKWRTFMRCTRNLRHAPRRAVRWSAWCRSGKVARPTHASPAPTPAKARSRTSAHCFAQRRVFYEGPRAGRVLPRPPRVPARSVAGGHVAYDDAVRSGLGTGTRDRPLNEVWRAQSAQEAPCRHPARRARQSYGRGERELNWVVRWAQALRPIARLDAGIEGHKPSTYGIDTDGDSGLRPLGLLAARLPCCASTQRRARHPDPGQSSRAVQAWCHARLARARQRLLSQFERPPAAVLYRPWGLSGLGRRFPRRQKAGDRLHRRLARDRLRDQGASFSSSPSASNAARAFRDDISCSPSASGCPRSMAAPRKAGDANPRR